MKQMPLMLFIAFSLLGVYHVTAQTKGDVRFVGAGSTISTGRVQLYWDNVWNTICVTTAKQARVGDVICKQMGFKPTTPETVTDTTKFGPVPTASTPQKSVVCDGSEKFVNDGCAVVTAVSAVCSHANDYLLLCKGSQPGVVTTTKKPDLNTLPPVTCNTVGLSSIVKLEGGPSTKEGRVMVKYNSVWRAICDDGWGVNDAKVVCAMLCSTSTQAVALTGMYTTGVSAFWLNNLQCLGTETDISRCPHDGWDSASAKACKPKEAASVRCEAVATIPAHYPQPTIKCTNNRIEATFSNKHHPNVKPEHIGLLKDIPSCGFTSAWQTNSLEFIVATVPFTACGTQLTGTATQLIYNNTFKQVVPDVGQTVNRIQMYEVPVACSTPNDATVPPKPIQPSIIRVPLVTGGLSLQYDMNFYDKAGKLLTTGQVPLGEVFNVQLDLTSDDTSLKMIVKGCYGQAGQTSTVHQLISNKCAVDSTVVFKPINYTSFSFDVASFQFKNDLNAQIYIHCDVHVCKKSEKTTQCDQSCSTRRRRREVSRVGEPAPATKDVVSDGFRVTVPEGDDWIVVEEGEILRYKKVTWSMTTMDPLLLDSSTMPADDDEHFESTVPPTLVPQINESPGAHKTTEDKTSVSGNFKDNVIAVQDPGDEASGAASTSMLSLFSLVASMVAMAMTFIIR